MTDKPKRYLKATRDGSSCVYSLDGALEELKEHFVGSEVDNAVTFSVVTMTAAEYAAMPEFKGW